MTDLNNEFKDAAAGLNKASDALVNEVEDAVNKAEATLDKAFDEAAEKAFIGPWAAFKKWLATWVAVEFMNTWKNQPQGVIAVTPFSLDFYARATDGCFCGLCDNTRRRFLITDLTLLNFRFSIALGLNPKL